MDFPQEALTQLNDYLTKSSWKHYNLFGGSERHGILPCKRIIDYQKPKPNVLKKYGMNWGASNLDAYQCGFVIHHKTIPNIVVNWNRFNDDDFKHIELDQDNIETISHVCLSPAITGGTNACIEGSHITMTEEIVIA